MTSEINIPSRVVCIQN